MMGGAGIAFQSVRVKLGAARILDGVSARIESGRVTAIVGPNGAGKSTLLRSVIGAVPIEDGRIEVGEHDLVGLDARALARAVAFVPQDVRVEFSFRVRDVVAMGRYPHLEPLERERPEDLAATDAAIGRLALDALRDRDVTTLSEGESQRTLVARALATGASSMLLDEPVSHLDLSHRLELMSLLRSLAREGSAIGIVLHELDLALRFADQLIVLDGGTVVAECEPSEALDSGVLANVFGVVLERVHGANGEPGIIARSHDGSGLQCPPAIEPPGG